MFFAKNGESEFAKKPNRVILHSIGIFLIFLIVCFLAKGQSTFNRPVYRIGTKEAAKCFSNLRLIIGAVEMYNLDGNEMIKTFDADAVLYLLNKNYLKKEPERPTNHCDYLSEGDLTDKGFIYCEYHGSLDGRIKGKSGIPREYVVSYIEDNKKANKEDFPIYVIVLLVFIPAIIRFILGLLFTEKQVMIMFLCFTLIIVLIILSPNIVSILSR